MKSIEEIGKKAKTPLMKQYYHFKKQFPEALLFFQVGDFFELFFDDAKKAANFLGIALTSRGTVDKEPIPLCGVPVHALDHYLIKLVKGGFRVVICEQTTKPQPGKIVERGIKQVLTPGTLTDLNMLQDKSASYLAIMYPTMDRIALIFIEILTGQIFLTILDTSDKRMLGAELSRFLPDEIIIPNTKLGKAYANLAQKHGYITTLLEETLDKNSKQNESVKWFKNLCSNDMWQIIEKSEVALSAINIGHDYLKKHFSEGLDQCKQALIYSSEDFLVLDHATQKNLELVQNLHAREIQNTLFSVLDQASTSMGSRQIKKWILRPLIKKALIEQRLDAIETLISNQNNQEALKTIFKQTGDVERVVGRISLNRATLHDYISLKNTLKLIPEIQTLMGASLSKTKLLNIIQGMLGNFSTLHELLDISLNNEQEKDFLIKPGYNQQLDKYRDLVNNSTQAILALEKQEQEHTKINSLKIKYNRVHGYGIEITKPNLHLVPDNYQRQQTLLNRERFITKELKELEYEIQKATNNIQDLEQKLFTEICTKVKTEVPELKKCSQALAHLDALISLATIAYKQNYVRPTFYNTQDILIKNGRHPVVEAQLKENFIPNDTTLNDQEKLLIITGPNMGGKSTYLRQVALITIMAQLGSFVPATQAQLPIIDRIFTRIGAADNVAAGKSTFFIEMEETALICTQATSKSLVILDEVGRGTSTYDGMALAQAIIEYIYEKINAKCLFATHYHELTTLTKTHPNIITYHASSKKTPDGIILLHKIAKGISEGSFGLEVAKNAGIPKKIIKRASNILKNLTN